MENDDEDVIERSSCFLLLKLVSKIIIVKWELDARKAHI